MKFLNIELTFLIVNKKRRQDVMVKIIKGIKDSQYSSRKENAINTSTNTGGQ